MSASRVIKKYPNRRLYDTSTSRYVALDDLRQLACQGMRFEVIDDRTGEDITRSVLLQLVVDRESDGAPVLTTDFLYGLLSSYGDAMHAYLGFYLEKSLAAYADQQETLAAMMDTMLKQTPFAMLTELAERNASAWAAFQPRAGSSVASSEASEAVDGEESPRK